MEKGEKLGIAKNQKEVVINMYKEKIDIEVICKVTGLTKEEVQDIIRKEKFTS